MPTIRDVAKLAGVAPITVSRAINNSGYVKEETRARVEAAIGELGYIPNTLGLSLRSKKTMTIAAVITDITNPFWTTVTRGIEDVALGSGYSTILCNTDESDEKQEQYLQMLLRRRIDGILFVPASSEAAPIIQVKKQKIPIVLMDRIVPGVDVDIVRSDSEQGAYLITEHLLSLGHQRIAMLSGPQNISTSIDRVGGYRRAFHDTGLSISAEHIFWGEYTQESGYKMAQQMLTELPDITALVTANNFIAIGAMKLLYERKIRVPEDIALVTVDDIPPAFTVAPFFTVAIQAALEMGKQAAQLLLNRLSGAMDAPCQEIILPVQMTIRASSGEKVLP
ncbi:MAG: LacI family DNA-binding transcriptional regulator [Chloroflexi bacterium]|nr:LacI family DNA-binding transcriptional regulator [Chloroflexota bacterium]